MAYVGELSEAHSEGLPDSAALHLEGSDDDGSSHENASLFDNGSEESNSDKRCHASCSFWMRSIGAVGQ